MKRVISAASFNSQVTHYSNRIVKNQKFSIHQNFPKDPNNLKADISEVHPYDEADYAWARIGSKGHMQVQFIRNGKVFDTMQFAYFDEDYHDPEAYINDVINTVCEDLLDFNKDVEPVMVHN